MLGGVKTLAWGFAMAPHRLRTLVVFVAVVVVIVYIIIATVVAVVPLEIMAFIFLGLSRKISSSRSYL